MNVKPTLSLGFLIGIMIYEGTDSIIASCIRLVNFAVKDGF